MKRYINVLIIGLLTTLVFSCGPDLARFEKLREPRIHKKQAQKMIVLELQGDPSQTSGKAFSTLYKFYYHLERPKEAFPQARWPKPINTPREQWLGIFGLPVSNMMKELPESTKKAKHKIELRQWKYGEVAEILHVGPFERERPTIQKLHAFIKEKGYKISGLHEEEYIKGPGMFLKGNPDKYMTIIRYPVVKVEK